MNITFPVYIDAAGPRQRFEAQGQSTIRRQAQLIFGLLLIKFFPVPPSCLPTPPRVLPVLYRATSTRRSTIAEFFEENGKLFS